MKTLKNRILRLLTVMMLMTLTPVGAFGQSAAESYDTGLALMKKQDYSGAIDNFKKSMAINKSAANVKKCKAQISKCQKLMKNKGKTPTPAPAPEKKLDLSAYNLPVPANPPSAYSIQVTASPESNDWTAIAEGSVTWVELSKSMDSKSLQLKVQPTNSTIVRRASVAVTYGNVIKKINVTQAGKAVELVPSSLFTKFRKKGGQMLINVTCNSDTTYSNNFNWYVEKAPEWCNAENTSTNLVLNVAPLEKKGPYFKTGRTGDIILRSQDQEVIIRVDQK